MQIGHRTEILAFRISVRWPIYIINSVDKTKFLYTTSPPTQHHSFFRNYPFDQFITSVNSFHPALKYTWEISETSLAYLDIKVSISGNVLCTSVHYKPTDSHIYLMYSSSHPSSVKNSIPYFQFLRHRRLCSDDSDFSSKSKEMCQFFEKRGYPVSVVKVGHHRAQQFDRQSSLQTSQKK